MQVNGQNVLGYCESDKNDILLLIKFQIPLGTNSNLILSSKTKQWNKTMQITG